MDRGQPERADLARRARRPEPRHDLPRRRAHRDESRRKRPRRRGPDDDHGDGGTGGRRRHRRHGRRRRHGGTIQIGDRVEVEATTDTGGTNLVAVSVHTEGAGNEQHTQEYHGTVTGTDTTANTITVQWTETNDAAHTWLAAHANPNPVTISLAGANIEREGGLPIQTGDRVEIEATTDTGGTNLIAVNVHAGTGGHH